MLKKIKLYAHTLKYLKLSQLYWQLRYRIYRSRKNKIVPFVKIKEFKVPIFDWVNKKSFINESRIELININKSYQLPSLWEDKSGDDLWFYNIHYFDYVNNSKVDDSLKFKYVLNWIENVDHHSAAWEPYPTSLRIVNWIKWLSKNKITDQKILQSLYSQCCHLDKNIEHHILANHLFANIKAMIIAGLFFDSAKSYRWLEKYTSMLLREIKVQILENGGHYELSPMYHNIILEDILEIIAFYKVYSQSLPKILIQTAGKMLAWSGAMTHPDGDVSFFNDSVFGIAATLSELKNFACTLGIDTENQPEIISDCDGYYVAKRGLWDLKFDAANVKAAHQPGHTHADALSFELSVGTQRFFVNSGISTYHDLKARQEQRSTSAHNALVIDGKNSSDVWSKFRLAARAKILNRSVIKDENEIVLSASHDGFKSLKSSLIRTRQISVSENSIIIRDSVEGGSQHNVELFFYLHPKIDVVQKGKVLFLNSTDQKLKLIFSSDFEIKDSLYFPSFNCSQRNQVIVVTHQMHQNYSHTLNVEIV